MDIGATIKAVRKERGLRQNILAKSIGISVNALSLIETDETFPKQETIRAICKALNIPVAYLLFSSITEQDLPYNKIAAFNALRPAVKQILLNNG